MDDFDDLLRRRKRAMHFLAHGLLAHAPEKVLDNLEVDVGFEQRQPYLAQRLVDVGLGQNAFAREFLEDGVEFLSQAFEHRKRASRGPSVPSVPFKGTKGTEGTFTISTKKKSPIHPRGSDEDCSRMWGIRQEVSRSHEVCAQNMSGGSPPASPRAANREDAVWRAL